MLTKRAVSFAPKTLTTVFTTRPTAFLITAFLIVSPIGCRVRLGHILVQVAQRAILLIEDEFIIGRLERAEIDNIDFWIYVVVRGRQVSRKTAERVLGQSNRRRGNLNQPS